MENYRFWLVFVILLAAVTVYINLPDTPGVTIDGAFDFQPEIVQGLDLQGGSRVLLRASIDNVEDSDMDVAADIIERRVNGLGLSEAIVQRQGSDRIIVELPGVSDRELALETIQATALLEFVDYSVGSARPGEGACVYTTAQQDLDEQRRAEEEGPVEDPTPEIRPTFTPPPPPPTSTPNAAIFGKAAPTDAQITAQDGGVRSGPEIESKCNNGVLAGTDGRATGSPFPTIITGEALDGAQAVINPNTNQYEIAFSIAGDFQDEFAAHTRSHVGQPMAIVLDSVVLSAPVIQAVISDSGSITGDFTRQEAQVLANQLRFGALPVPLEVAAYDQIGPTLGEISIERSVRAGVIGVIVVLIFMSIYYRVPGVAAALALMIFASINFALYKSIPVTLTLPAITGFLISIGTAVDGNILIFERMKEELRDGKRLDRAVNLGFERAWTSIRDSNISTIIICIILFVFGRTFGASAVQGFAITLGIGLVINLFTAIVVTRTWLALFLDLFGERLAKNKQLMGA
jgi:preprotein translocase subunit SecD